MGLERQARRTSYGSAALCSRDLHVSLGFLIRLGVVRAGSEHVQTILKTNIGNDDHRDRFCMFNKSFWFVQVLNIVSFLPKALKSAKPSARFHYARKSVDTCTRIHVYVYTRTRTHYTATFSLLRIRNTPVYAYTCVAPCAPQGGPWICVSQRGNSPFAYRDGTGWPASLPYIRKISVSRNMHSIQNPSSQKD